MKEIWFSQAASYDCDMNNKQAKEKGETILCLKREGQARSPALVKDGIRTQESEGVRIWVSGIECVTLPRSKSVSIHKKPELNVQALCRTIISINRN